MTHNRVRFLRDRANRYSRYTSVMRLAAIAVLIIGFGFGNVALAQTYGTKSGQIHPDFRLPKLSGGFGHLSDYRGKNVVLINFASW